MRCRCVCSRTLGNQSWEPVVFDSNNAFVLAFDQCLESSYRHTYGCQVPKLRHLRDDGRNRHSANGVNKIEILSHPKAVLFALFFASRISFNGPVLVWSRPPCTNMVISSTMDKEEKLERRCMIIFEVLS